MFGDDNKPTGSSNVDDNSSSKGMLRTSQYGGPSEERPRKGQMDWVIGIKGISDFRSWLFKFKTGAALYLSKDVYSKKEERSLAWTNALLKAASMGNFEEMCQLIELYCSAGIECEAILKKLEERFLPALDIDRKKAGAAFMAFKREDRSLHTALKDLNLLMLECAKYDYRPEDTTVILKLEGLLMPAELPTFRMYLRNEDSSLSMRERTLAALEALGKDLEDCHSGERDGPFFAGGAFNKGKKKNGPRRSGFIPNSQRHNQQLQNTSQKHDTSNRQREDRKPCSRCGSKKCPLARGEEKTKCFAHNKTCNKCHRQGHFESVCKSKQTASVAVETAKAQANKEADSF